jgi:hypothetical protein
MQRTAYNSSRYINPASLFCEHKLLMMTDKMHHSDCRCQKSNFPSHFLVADSRLSSLELDHLPPSIILLDLRWLDSVRRNWQRDEEPSRRLLLQLQSEPNLQWQCKSTCPSCILRFVSIHQLHPELLTFGVGSPIADQQ